MIIISLFIYISSYLIPSSTGGIRMDEMLVLLFDGEDEGSGYTDVDNTESQDAF